MVQAEIQMRSRDPSLEPFQQDGSNERPQHLFVWKNMENNP